MCWELNLGSRCPRWATMRIYIEILHLTNECTTLHMLGPSLSEASIGHIKPSANSDICRNLSSSCELGASPGSFSWVTSSRKANITYYPQFKAYWSGESLRIASIYLGTGCKYWDDQWYLISAASKATTRCRTKSDYSGFRPIVHRTSNPITETPSSTSCCSLSQCFSTSSWEWIHSNSPREAMPFKACRA
jgi:hypothetical protein